MTRNEIERRYKRQVIAGETVAHDVGCWTFVAEICTCGLLHALARMDSPDEDIYPRYADELALHEWQLGRVQAMIQKRQEALSL